MKYITLLSLSAVLLTSSINSYANNTLAQAKLQAKQNKNQQSKQSIKQPKIVGGADSTEGDYPFMSALVVTSDSVITTLSVNNSAFESTGFSFAVAGQATANIVSCGLGGETCVGVTDSICLIERGDFNFSEKAINCENGGGLGAIIYNNVEGPITSATLGEDFTGGIPVVAVSQADGEAILALENASATLSVETGGLAQDSSCGATFLGDKWVLTASHCVEGIPADFYKVNIGEFDLRDGAENALTIARIYMHPNYDAAELNNDVALLELAESVDAPAVTLADAMTTDQLAIENSPSTSIGWGGRVGYGPYEGETSDFPDILQEVELQLLTNAQCRNTLADSQGILASQTGVTEQMICAAVDAGGKSTCQGDSGGPLLVNTNTGMQQVGVVSWGIGCAVQGFPGVYARVGALRGWLDSAMSGLSIDGSQNFTAAPVGTTLTQTYTVTNNSDQSAMITVTPSNAGVYTVDLGSCTTLAAGASCEIELLFASDTGGSQSTDIVITSDVAELKTSGMSIAGQAIPAAQSLAAQAGTANAAVTWFSGGDLPWQNAPSSGLISGAIDDLQDSILIARIEGTGSLAFNWAVSSEENTEDPLDPFDALYLYVNGEQIDFISGDVPSVRKTITLTEDINLVEWRYSKDLNTKDLDDQASLMNVVFTPTQTPTTPTTPTSNSGGGGSTSWLLLLSMAGLLVRRATNK